jgi:hypothetical protein
MKYLTLASILALINAAPNQPPTRLTNPISVNYPNQSCKNNPISTKSILLTYSGQHCYCNNLYRNIRDINLRAQELNYPIEIFTTDASNYLKRNNFGNDNYSTDKSSYLLYEFDSMSKMIKYCGKFKNLGWNCNEVAATPNIAVGTIGIFRDDGGDNIIGNGSIINKDNINTDNSVNADNNSN